MAEFIPTLTWTQFKNLKPEQLKQMKSCEVEFNSEYIFTFVNGYTEPSGFLRVNTEYRAMEANAVGGKTYEELLDDKVRV